MTLDEAGRLQVRWRAKKGSKSCAHNRMVSFLVTEKGDNSGSLVCMECGYIFTDPLTQLGSDQDISKL